MFPNDVDPDISNEIVSFKHIPMKYMHDARFYDVVQLNGQQKSQI